MAGWLVLTLSLPLNSSALQPTAFHHVRSSEAQIRTLIADGYARSPTFRTLIDSVEDLSCFVYVASAVKLSGGMRGALLHWPASSRQMPVLRVLLKTNLSRDEGIAIIGHELQHVVEAVRNGRSTTKFDMTATFESLEPALRGSNTRKYETDAAIVVTAKVLDELKRHKRGGEKRNDGGNIISPR